MCTANDGLTPTILAAACWSASPGKSLVLVIGRLLIVLLETETDFKAVPVISLLGVVFAACPLADSFIETDFFGPEDEAPELLLVLGVDESPALAPPPDLRIVSFPLDII